MECLEYQEKLFKIKETIQKTSPELPMLKDVFELFFK